MTLMCWRCKLLKRSSDRSTDLWRRQTRQRSVVQWCVIRKFLWGAGEARDLSERWTSNLLIQKIVQLKEMMRCMSRQLQDPEQIMQELSSKTWYTNQPAKHGLDAWKELTRLTTASASLVQTGIWPDLHCKSVCWHGFERPHSMAFWLLLDFARVGKI